MPTDSKNASVIKRKIEDDVATVAFNRPDKRNAVNNEFIEAPDAFFSNPPDGVKAAILTCRGGHFCAGLDLAEHESRTPVENVHQSRDWHRVIDQIEFGGLPVISVLTGAVMGGGLEIAASTHCASRSLPCEFSCPKDGAAFSWTAEPPFGSEIFRGLTGCAT